MIVVNLNGGLGNQMFQYAAGLELALKFNQRLKFDSTFLDYYPHSSLTTKRSYELDKWKVEHEPWLENYYPYTLIRNKYYFYLLSQIQRRIKKLKIVKENSFFKVDKSQGVMLKGYFQSEKYFVNVRDQLLNHFTPSKKLDTPNQEILHKIENSTSVSVHVRRGDYLKKHNQANHGMLHLEYYVNAINQMKTKVINPQFYFFSDDANWVRMTFKDVLEEFSVVDINQGEHAYLDMWLMRHCNHHIIANSSFSWWPAWLCERVRSIVIAPENWYSDKKKNQDFHLPEAWVRI